MEEERFENLPVLFSRLDTKKDHWASSLPTDTIKDKYSAVGKMGLINSITRKWLESGRNDRLYHVAYHLVLAVMI